VCYYHYFTFRSINVWENSPKLDVGIYHILCELFTNIDPIYSSHNSHNAPLCLLTKVTNSYSFHSCVHPSTCLSDLPLSMSACLHTLYTQQTPLASSSSLASTSTYSLYRYSTKLVFCYCSCTPWSLWDVAMAKYECYCF